MIHVMFSWTIEIEVFGYLDDEFEGVRALPPCRVKGSWQAL